VKRIVLLVTVVAVMATLIAVSSFSVGAQTNDQYAPAAGQTTDQYAPTSGQAADTGQASPIICAPWSKAWDVSDGKWVYQWYRWCVDTSLYDPSLESSWYMELGKTHSGDPVNLCPGQGSCTMTTGQGTKQMSSDTTSSPVTDTQTATDSTAPPPADAQTPTDSTSPATDTQTPTTTTP
jgi:hypothetical protein